MYGDFDTYDEASAFADALNDKLGLTPHDAARIIGTTMRKLNKEREVKKNLQFVQEVIDHIKNLDTDMAVTMLKDWEGELQKELQS
jgi:hypothetical protein